MVDSNQMSQSAAPLPEFEAPPVSEVALSVQFAPIENLTTFQIAALWESVFKERLPKVEEHAPLESNIERFGISKIAKREAFRLEAFDRPPIPRFWFTEDLGNQLIQVQPDRFVRNWRKMESSTEYPRYPAVRESFSSDFQSFETFVKNRCLGEVVVNQCEMTYVNTIAMNEWDDLHSKADRIISPWSGAYSDEFLPVPEDINATARFIIPASDGNPLGRLYVTLAPRFLIADNVPVFILTLMVRGLPEIPGLEGILRFFDIAHEWIVRGFTSFTTSEMHTIWRRKHA
jgi:uncharacterized protein (TIGR04255 family)